MSRSLLALLALGLALSSPRAGAAASQETLSRLRAAHEARPDDPRVALELGLLLYRRDNASREAQRLLEPVAARFPKERGVQLALLDSYLAAGDPAAAGELLRRLDPELDADERFALDTAYCLLGRGRSSEAQTQWGRVAKRVQQALQAASGRTLDPEADRALRRRVAEVVFIQGLLAARLGEKDEALRLLTQADGYGFPPSGSPLMMVAADCLEGLQEPGLARKAYQQVLAHAPENVEARLRLGVSLFGSAKFEEARAQLEEVLRKAPNYPRAHYYLGAVLFEQKRTDEARIHLERELARDAGCSRCMAKLAHLAYLGGDDATCEAWLAKARALDPDGLETNLVAGMLAIRNGRYPQAIQHLAGVVARAPGSLKGQFQLAIAYQRNGDVERAREHRQIYERLIREEKARTLGVRGSGG